MQLCCGSHEDFDCFIVPTVPPLKQQQDTIATAIELALLGVPPAHVKRVFNMTEAGMPAEESFYWLLAFLAAQPLAAVNTACRIRSNDIHARIRGTPADLATLAVDDTDYKAMIVKSHDPQRQARLAQELATRSLAAVACRCA